MSPAGATICGLYSRARKVPTANNPPESRGSIFVSDSRGNLLFRSPAAPWPCFSAMHGLESGHDRQTDAPMMDGDTARARSAAALAAVLLLGLADAAFAFRCGSRIVQEGMHQWEVVEICGEPVSTRHIGFVVRTYDPRRHNGRDTYIFSNGYRYYNEEVEVVEMIFNFGPRKLMRKLRFEGGILASIRTMGYGYAAKDEQ